MNAARLALPTPDYSHRGTSSMHDVICRSGLKSTIATCAFAAACIAGAGRSSAGTIIWGDATTISADGDVSSNGTLVYAYNIGGAGVQTTTVNGVQFNPFVWPKLITNAVSNANVSVREIGGSLNVYDTLGSASGSYGSLSSSYKTLLNSGGSATVYAYLEVTLKGLTNGQDYALQWWSSNGSNALGDDGQSLATTIAATSFGSSPQVTLSSNVSNSAGGLGQYVIGEFKASGTNQVFLLTGPSVDKAPLINGFQVRAVPEPATYAMALAGIACGGFWMWRRRKRAWSQSVFVRYDKESSPMKSSRVFNCLTACGLLAPSIFATSSGTTAVAAPIVWGSPRNISGDSDVLTTGSLVYAYNFGLAGLGGVTATTVNGVEFLPFQCSNELQQSIVVGSLRLVESPAFLFAYDSFDSANAPYSGLSPAYKALLSQAIYASEPGTITVTLGGLTDGQDYSVQWWTNDSSRTYQSLTTASGLPNVTLDPNTTALAGGLGQYAIGTFTASGTSQDFELTGSVGPDASFNFPMISGLQIRAVPEPTTCIMALAGLACGGFSMWRRRKRA